MSLLASCRTRVIRVTHFAERYLFSLMYLLLAMRSVWSMVDQVAMRPGAGLEQGLWVVGVIREVDLLAVMLLMGVLLLLSRPPAEPPREWKEVLVPAAVTLFFVTYGLPALLPEAWRVSLAPVPVQVWCAEASLVMEAAGSLLSMWGILALGRSFGIFVAVRQIVLAGPYRYVRHPIYSGYVLIWSGMILANLSLGVIVLVSIHLLLMIYRARLEERRLSEASAEYRAYVRQTGFLFPRIGRRGMTA